jgi:tetratricopeptide (TPR) repeat protein
MNKTLKPYTIIPPSLYVKRDADRQLYSILEDMGRPGYVLVSRQMGKTNLLLNAKREAETPNDIFVYIDLSNPFDTAKDCFENIIDTILEVGEDKLFGVYKIIQGIRRESNDIPAHKQHIRELRTILNTISGKLVIILDEIDALTKTTYSDRIFSQVRSIYFSRVNFPELSKLTYLLSGVIEPTEIIKDSKISPFNIGQKIFLNDFSYKEFMDFLDQAKLNLDTDTKDYVYTWTSGNPRMTWDVCAEIESLMIENKAITTEEVDIIIKNTYLTSFDKPPIDNIRELVKNDAEIRNAIVEIEYKKGQSIADRIKSKLYLAGVVNYTNENVNLKNEIIRKSLSLDWIQSIEEEEKGLITIASEQLARKEFNEALSTYEKYLKNNSFHKNDQSVCYYNMGYAAYYAGKFDQALEYLKKTSFDKEDDAKSFYRDIHLKALASCYVGDYDFSMKCFRTLLAKNKKDDFGASALFNLGTLVLSSKNLNYIDEAKKIFNKIIDKSAIDKSTASIESLNHFEFISYYNLGQIEKYLQNIDEAIKYYKEAMSRALDNFKPIIILNLFSVTKDNQKKQNLLKTLVSLIVEKNIEPKEVTPYEPMGFSREQFKEILVLLYSEKDKELFNAIKSKICLLGNKRIGETLYELALYSMRKMNKIDTAVNLLEDVYENKHKLAYKVTKESYYEVLKSLSYLSTPENKLEVFEQFAELFSTTTSKKVSFIDIEIFGKLINYLANIKNFDDAFKYIEIINSAKDIVPKDDYISYLFIYYLELNLYLKCSDSDKSFTAASEILLLSDKKKKSFIQGKGLSEKDIDIIVQNATMALKEHIPMLIQNSFQKPKLSNARKKIGRNETVKVKYKNGNIKKKKYRKVLNDINSGLCILLEN